MSSGKSTAATLHALCEQGLQLHRAGRFEEARACYKKVLQRDPRHFNALHLLGALCAQLHEAELGLAMLQRALTVDPQAAAARSLVGVTLEGLGRREEALASFDRAIALQPDLLDAHYNRAGLLQRWDRLADALMAYDQVIALSPGLAEAHYNRGLLLESLGRPDEAFAGYDRALALKPTLAEAWYNRGLMLKSPERANEALASFDKALSLRPHFAEALLGRGVALQSLGRCQEALDAIDQAVAIRPDYADAHHARGRSLHEVHRLDEAIASYDRAIALNPDDRGARFSRAIGLLTLGRYKEAWRDFECRSVRWQRPPRDLAQRKQWRGVEDLDGKTLLVFHEQGLGDTIQFARYVPLLAPKGAKVVLSVQDTLAPLLRQLCPSDAVLAQDQTPAVYDYHSSLVDLPGALGTTLESIPLSSGYLRAEAGRREHFEALLGPRTRPRIGLAWSGNPKQENDRNRSMTFEHLTPLLSQDADWFCLQNEIRAVDVDHLKESGVRFLGDHLKDFADTAALVDQMDLVVSVCTSIAHLAGAMGKPLWVMLAYTPDWRWMLQRSDSPWYASARLFRQPVAGEWDAVVAMVRGQLQSSGSLGLSALNV